MASCSSSAVLGGSGGSGMTAHTAVTLAQRAASATGAATADRRASPGPAVQVPPNCDLTLGMVCLDKSEPGPDRLADGRRRAVRQPRRHRPGRLPGGLLRLGHGGRRRDLRRGRRKVVGGQRRDQDQLPRAGGRGGGAHLRGAGGLGGQRTAFVEAGGDRRPTARWSPGPAPPTSSGNGREAPGPFARRRRACRRGRSWGRPAGSIDAGGTSTKGAWQIVGLFDRRGAESTGTDRPARERRRRRPAGHRLPQAGDRGAAPGSRAVPRPRGRRLACPGLGVVLLLLALLRLLQTETGTTFAGNLSWIPYLIVTVVAVADRRPVRLAGDQGAGRAAVARRREERGA